MHRLVATLVASLVLASLAQAVPQFQAVSQARSVSGSANAYDEQDFASDSDSDQADNFLPFNAGASAQANVFSGTGSGGGSQTSSFTNQLISAKGSAFAVGDGWDFSGGGGGSGSSQFQMTFDLAVETPYTLTGTLGGFDNGGSSLSFARDGNVIFSDNASGVSDLHNFSDSGTLLPGRYTLTCSAGASANGGFGFTDYGSAEYCADLQLIAGAPVPSMGEYGVLALLLGLAGVGGAILRRRA